MLLVQYYVYFNDYRLHVRTVIILMLTKAVQVNNV